ncbi:MAG: lamin tail domain-containing protein [Akkermansiaceae bacterium]
MKSNITSVLLGLILLSPLSKGQLLITEFLASNSSGLTDEDGDHSDWIEIHNPSASAVNLNGWHLTDDSGQLSQWTFPAVSLNPGGYLVVFASEKNRAVAGNELHANFKLSSSGEYLALVKPNGSTIASEFSPAYPEQKTDISYGYSGAGPTSESVLLDSSSPISYHIPINGTLGTSWTAIGFNNNGWDAATMGIGYEDNPSSSTSFSDEISTTLPSGTTTAYVRIPFSVADASALSSLVMKLKYDDGFVAYLNGVKVAEANKPADLDWESSATGSHVDGVALEFVAFDLSAHLNSLVTGTNVLAIHMLNINSGSSDFLMSAELAGMVAIDFSTAAIGFIPNPTPGFSNSEAFDGILTDTTFASPRGIYTASFNEVIAGKDSGSTLIYTTDGSEPSLTNGTQVPPADAFTPPTATIPISTTTILRIIAVRDGYIPTNVDTQTYIFPAHVANQPAQPVGFPTDWGTQNDFFTVADYEMDSSVATTTQLSEALNSLPAMSIVMDQDDLFDPTTGIYSNSLKDGSLWERPTSVELIHPDGTSGFQENAGIRIQGSAARRPWSTPKHSFRIIFKKQYGVGKLEHPLFPDSQVERFNTLVLRATFNDAWTISASSQSDKALYLSDQWARNSQRDMGQPAAPGRYINLYANGLYWGVYNLHERPDAAFQSEHQGGSESDWDVIKHKSPPEVVDGNIDSWNTVYGDAADTPLDYNKVIANLDEISLIDYMLLNMYGGTTDWLPNNWYGAYSPVRGYQFFIWDAEQGFTSTNNTGKSNANSPARIYSELRESAEFRMLFADRAHRALFNDGALTASASQDRLQALADEAGLAMRAESARWGDVRKNPPYTYESDWLPELNRIMTFLSTRGDVCLAHLRGANLYPDVDAPVFSQHGGEVASNYTLTMTTDSGVTYYSLDGSDPRLPGGNVNPAAFVYNNANPPELASSGIIRARTLSDGEWSALNEATFVVGVPASGANLVISEFSYRPAAPTAAEDPGGIYGRKDFEFIELLNISNSSIELTNVAFTSGVTFDFNTANITQLAPGQRIVIVENPTAFSIRYPSVPASSIVGTFSGSLSNDGEEIKLTAADGSTIRSFIYNDQLPWPTAADGDGFSLVLNAPASNPDHSHALNWKPSAAIGGTPASDGGIDFSSTANADDDNDGIKALVEYFFGTSDTDSTSGSELLGHELSSGEFGIIYTRDLSARNVQGIVQISTDLVNWVADPGDQSLIELVHRVHNGNGTETLSWRPANPAARVFMRLKVSQ